MSVNAYKTIINSVSQDNIERIFISGGEPLLHRDIKSFISIAKKHHIIPFLYSSGSIYQDNNIQPVSAKTFQELVNEGLDSVAFSIYSLTSFHDEHITKTKGSLKALEKTLDNIKEIKSLKKEFNFIPLKENMNEIEDIIDFSIKYGVMKLNILKLIPQGRAKRNSPQLKNMSNSEEVEFFKRIYKKHIETGIEIEISKLYNTDNYHTSLISEYKKNENEKFITVYSNEIPSRRFRDDAQ